MYTVEVRKKMAVEARSLLISSFVTTRLEDTKNPAKPANEGKKNKKECYDVLVRYLSRGTQIFAAKILRGEFISGRYSSSSIQTMP